MTTASTACASLFLSDEGDRKRQDTFVFNYNLGSSSSKILRSGSCRDDESCSTSASRATVKMSNVTLLHEHWDVAVPMFSHFPNPVILRMVLDLLKVAQAANRDSFTNQVKALADGCQRGEKECFDVVNLLLNSDDHIVNELAQRIGLAAQQQVNIANMPLHMDQQPGHVALVDHNRVASPTRGGIDIFARAIRLATEVNDNAGQSPNDFPSSLESNAMNSNSTSSGDFLPVPVNRAAEVFRRNDEDIPRHAPALPFPVGSSLGMGSGAPPDTAFDNMSTTEGLPGNPSPMNESKHDDTNDHDDQDLKHPH